MRQDSCCIASFHPFGRESSLHGRARVSNRACTTGRPTVATTPDAREDLMRGFRLRASVDAAKLERARTRCATCVRSFVCRASVAHTHTAAHKCARRAMGASRRRRCRASTECSVVARVNQSRRTHARASTNAPAVGMKPPHVGSQPVKSRPPCVRGYSASRRCRRREIGTSPNALRACVASTLVARLGSRHARRVN